jgi:hypothetical protein
MYSLGNYSSMPDMQMHGTGNEFLYSTLSSSYSSTAQQMNDWSHPKQQLQEHYQQQPQTQNFHQRDYLGHVYNQNPLSNSYPNYRPNYQLELPHHPLNPPLPPPPRAEYPPPPTGPRCDSLGGASTSAAKESPILCAAPTPPAQRGSNDPTTNAIDAINALSDLQNRWSVPVAGKRKDKESKTRKSNKRRKRGNKNVGTTSDNPIVFRDADEWIDVEDDTSTKDHQETCQKGYDLTSGEREIDFPPLTKSEDHCLASLGKLSTAELATYASVLRGALDQDDSVTQSPKNQVIELLNEDGVEGEMDISDEEQDKGVKPKSGGQGKKAGTLGSKLLINASPTSMDAAPQSNQEQDEIEKEKRALKLAELRAKAKLARTKLRIAEQKKAKGHAAREQLKSKIHASPSPKKHPDITALRDVGSLVIKDVSRTGPTDEVRFVSSVYRLQDYEIKDQVQDSTCIIAQHVTLSSEEKQKRSKSLTQQLQLARLQLEIKKKELEKRALEKKIKSISAGGVNSASKQPPEQFEREGSAKERVSEGGGDDVLIANQLRYETNGADGGDHSMQNNSESPALVGGAESRAKLEWLRHRQKELKQENEVANLRNLIFRQQGLLGQVGRELTESSSQLQSCVDGIKSKQELLDASEKKLNEMNHRKRIIEGMVLRATEQLIAARKVLSERRLASH